jgi:predicted deacylase
VEVRRSGSGRPELWVVAGVHGDEVEGIACVDEALATLQPERGTLVGVPVAHPAALLLGTRRGVDDVDLNRTYPGDPRGGPTERVADELWRLLEAGADALVTLHSWHRAGATTPYVEFAEDDERGRELALALGIPFAEPWCWPDGLLPNVAARRGIPAVEVELGGLGAQTPELLAVGVAAIRAAAAWLGMLQAEAPRRAQLVRRHVLRSEVVGRVRQLRRLGAPVARGDPVCELRELDGPAVHAVRSPVDGWLATHSTYGATRPGSELALVFEPVV